MQLYQVRNNSFFFLKVFENEMFEIQFYIFLTVNLPFTHKP